MVRHVFIYIALCRALLGWPVRISVEMVVSDFTILKHRTPRKLHSFKITDFWRVLLLQQGSAWPRLLSVCQSDQCSAVLTNQARQITRLLDREDTNSHLG